MSVPIISNYSKSIQGTVKIIHFQLVEKYVNPRRYYSRSFDLERQTINLYNK